MKNIRLDDLEAIPVITTDKDSIKKEREMLTKQLIAIQDKLFAQHKYSVLIILQGIDTAGKDNAVKRVFSGVNPAGCLVKSFKVPSVEEADHHFLWRINTFCPSKGMISIFNRSHYEDILIPLLNHTLDNKAFKQRCAEINVFEAGLVNDNTIVIKIYLHISHKEQVKRLEERKVDPNKKWKYTNADHMTIKEYHAFIKSYEMIFENCNEVKWNIIPSDKKWYKNYCILKLIVDTLVQYDIRYPLINTFKQTTKELVL